VIKIEGFFPAVLGVRNVDLKKKRTKTARKETLSNVVVIPGDEKKYGKRI